MKEHKNRRTGKLLLALIVTSLMTANTTFAGTKTYRWVDKQGGTIYSQAPPPAGDYQELKLRKETPDDQRAEAIKKLKNMQKRTSESRKKQQEQSNQEKKKETSETIRKENCKAAQDNLKMLKDHTIRLLKDDEGNYETLEDKRRETLIKEAQGQIQNFCNNPSGK